MNQSGSAAGEAAPALPDCVEIATGPEPAQAVIWLHGLGADGHDFEPIVPMLGLHRTAATRFVFPHAPVRPVTINGGMRMRAWYDIRGFELSRDQDEAGILASAAAVTALVQRENERGIPDERIVIAGFSQGGAIAVHAALRHPRRLAGLLALSTYLLFPQRLEPERHAANANLPVFMGHGTQDPVVPVHLGKELAARLGELGHPVTWRRYPMPHAVSPEEISDIGDWLVRRFD